MRSPSLPDLPPPPPGRTGFPWTEATPPLPERLPDGAPYPRVTVVTPSFNQAQYLEETIRSVLLQGYPDLEYIIMDGGSTDGSLAIIHKYAPWLAHWESLPDRGQAHAINKGWQRATGEILAWINSDDFYLPDAFHQAVLAIHAHQAGMVYSDCIIIDDTGNFKRNFISRPFDLVTIFDYGSFQLQQTTFYRREILAQVGWLNESLHYTMDTDLFIRLGLEVNSPFVYLPGAFFAKCREHSDAKSSSNFDKFPQEMLMVWDRVFAREGIPEKLAAVRKFSYSNIYYTIALHRLMRQDGRSALKYLWLSFYNYPTNVLFRPLNTLALVAGAARACLRRNPGASPNHKV